MMAPSSPPAHVTGLEELAPWLAAASARGAVRFELWVKVRGAEQERVHVGVASESFDLADELLVRVERDRRVELGQAAYAIFAYRGKDKAPSERAFVSLSMRAIAATPMIHEGNGAVASPSAAFASVLSTMQDMTRDVFGSLQRENEHQRRTNEAMMKSSTGYFETFAKGYERTFAALQTRLDASLCEAAELRAKNEQLAQEAKAIAIAYEEVAQSIATEDASTKRKDKRLDEMVEQAKVLAPLVIAKFGNKPGAEGLVTSGVLGALFGSLTTEQTATILNALNNAQRVVLGDVILAHQKSKLKTNPDIGSQGFADGVKMVREPTTPNSPPANDVVNGARERDFKHVFDVLNAQGDQYEKWLDDKAREFVEREKGDAKEATATPKADGEESKKPDSAGV